MTDLTIPNQTADEPALLAKRAEPVPLTVRQHKFAVGVASGLPAIDAYEAAYNAAGSSRATLRVNAHRLQHNPRVAARIRELVDAAGAVALRDTRALVRDLEEAVDVDPSELIALLTGACRWCWSRSGARQWASVDEFVEACDEVTRHNDSLPPGASPSLRRPMPDESSGFTYSFSEPPNPDCSRCDGMGITRVRFNSTADASPGARRLVKGIELHGDGTLKRLHLHCQMAMRQELHRLRGMITDRSVSVNVNANVPAFENMSRDEQLAFLQSLRPSP